VKLSHAAIRVRDLFRDSVMELKNTRSLAFAASVLALQVVLKMFVTINLTPNARISFHYITMALAGSMFGPFVAMMTGGFADLLAYFLGGATATGAYFPGFMITEMLVGLTYGYSLYKKNISFPRVVVTQLLINGILTLVLNTYWHYTLRGNAVLADIPLRAITNACQCAVYIVLMLPFIRRIREYLLALPRR